MREQDREVRRRSRGPDAGEVLDPVGRGIGRAEELFSNGDGGSEYVRVRIGPFFGGLVLMPVQGVALDGTARSLTLN